MQVRLGIEHLAFEDALDREQVALDEDVTALPDADQQCKVVNRIGYCTIGRYAVHLERWRAPFAEDQLLVIRSEDLFAEPDAVLLRVCAFLGIPERPTTPYPPSTVGGGVFEYGPMAPETRERLARAFVEPNRSLEELLGVELAWTKPTAVTVDAVAAEA